MAKKVSNLNFSSAGIDDEGFSYVEYDGLRFHGEKSFDKDKKYYKLLPRYVRNRLPFECFRTAQDIVIRYVEGGLKYGGPRKHDFYKVKAGDTVAEMGAFQGFYALKMCKTVGENGKMIAIEPLKDNLKFLKKNITYNKFENRCTIVPKGVWKEQTTLTFKRKTTDHQSGSIVMEKGNEDISLPVDTLENIMQETHTNACNMMVIQLNGVEINALKGLNSFYPNNLAIAARYDQPGVDAVDEITSLLVNRGYKVNVEEERFIFAALKEGQSNSN
ncbi:FkbM family methyltransferase [Salibacter sp.]|uniref:FkbM family methyltransferase n=1 Tax=Salibacter sp. TaxID=2010995 RepID=UPI00286FF307|nr:FkbM family methyltransferase [Salibacter sp.]MDR9486519.1 FkbM family methyltransferase [Salibacter sp.]